MHLYLVLTNPAHFPEYAHAAHAFPHLSLTLLQPPADLPNPAINQETFSGNATLRAQAYAPLAPGQIVVAEDSGLFVRGLAGAPGTRSDHYADDEHFLGPGTRDQRNIACVLDRARKLRYRDVSYVCSLAAVRDGALLAIGTGEVEGRLLDPPSPHPGQGYDPIFEVPELGMSMAEVDPETRIRTSHRGRALVDLIRRLQLNHL